MNDFLDLQPSDEGIQVDLINHTEAKQADLEGSTTPSEIKEISQELLRYGYIEEQNKPAVFRRAASRLSEINSVLEPLDFELKVDEHRGVAFLMVSTSAYDTSGEASEWTHPLIRRHRLNLEQSLVVAILRECFVLHEQETGVGSGHPSIAVEDLLPKFLTYFGDSGSDAKNESRLSNILDQLKTWGIVSEVDKNDEITIRPLIAHLANPDSLTQLLRVLESKSGIGKQVSKDK